MSRILEYIDKMNTILKLQNKGEMHNNIILNKSEYVDIKNIKKIIYDINYIQVNTNKIIHYYDSFYEFIYYKDTNNQYNLYIYNRMDFFNDKQIEYISNIVNQIKHISGRRIIIYDIKNYKQLIEIINQILLDE